MRLISRFSTLAVTLLLAFTGVLFGTIQWSTTPKMVSADPHGLFPAFAQTDASSPTEWANFIEPIIKCGPNNAASQAACPSGSANFAWYISGGSVEVKWNLTAPTKTATISGNSGGIGGSSGFSYSITDTNKRVGDWWSCGGDTTNCAAAPHKPVIFMLESTSYSDNGVGTLNPGVPSWYGCPGGTSPCLPQTATVSSTADGIITVTTATNITFLVGALVGSHPQNGYMVAAGGTDDGQTQGVMVSGTGTSMDGTWAICDHRTTIGSTTCADPGPKTLSLISTSGAQSAATGAINNPIIDLATDYCAEGGLPVFWSHNFVTAIQDYMAYVFTTWGGTSAVGDPPPAAVVEFEPGFLHGYESLISGNNTASAGANSCRSVLQAAGYPTGEPAGANFMVNTYLAAQYLWLQNSVIGAMTSKPISVSLNFSIYGTPDTQTAINIGKLAYADGLGINSNGLERGLPSMPTSWETSYIFPMSITSDNDAPYIFDLYGHGAHGTIWQTTKYSDPSNALTSGDCGSDMTCLKASMTGPMGLLLPWAISRGVNVIEPYMRTVECAEPGWTNSLGYPNQYPLIPENYANCENPGAGMPYDKAFIYAGQQLY